MNGISEFVFQRWLLLKYKRIFMFLNDSTLFFLDVALGMSFQILNK
tara:strand:+ start:229 stop:366 length:138 start_codon:yes stop_codon:yes gene_type:complete